MLELLDSLLPLMPKENSKTKQNLGLFFETPY
jgi:hypothetical protein